jgi:hypothetical protein
LFHFSATLKEKEYFLRYVLAYPLDVKIVPSFADQYDFAALWPKGEN